MTFPQFVFRNVSRNKRTYAAYFFSSAFSVLIFFVYALFIFHPDIKEGVTQALAIQLMIIAEVIMYVFSFLFVLYSVSTFLKSRKREFGILMIHGMTKSQLNAMVFLENMLIGIGAIVAGIGAGILTGKLFLMIGARMIGIPPLPFYLSGKALLLTICAFVILFLTISFVTTFLVKTNKLIDLFQANERPKKEPKVSTFLSILSAFLLTISYILAATATLQTLFFLMLPVITMTVIGTYFFYTQLSVFITKMLQKNRMVFWKKTNLLTISSLAYRLKDNARMFFMVTIVSTVAFCAVGALASMNVMNKQIASEYPAAVTYLAMDDQPIHKQHLQQIEDELTNKNIEFTTNQVPVKFIEFASTTNAYPSKQLAVLSFSSYKKISEAAGYGGYSEKPPAAEEALAMRQATLERFKSSTYTLKQNQFKLQTTNLSKHVTTPFTIIQDDGLIVSDELFEKLSAVKTGLLTGFYTNDLKATAGIGANLTENGRAFLSKENPFAMTVSGTIYEIQINMYKMMLFVAFLIGAVFFIAAGSFLYFRLYADLEYDLRHYLTIKKVGLTDQELNIIVTRQLALLFFIPVIVAIVHSSFAFMALQSLYTLSIAGEMAVVLGSFLVAQLVYFFVMRFRYLQSLRNSLII
ncbi:ABC-type transport system, involved in lipoprotein release, permease component [Schinkia azotoformans MEV2011]|uniref:ABC-type transport system, involved in lipoprotein release, permease component n=1 Tax=Schinkia azotoformans MEV2011 TaxID=1348973 RepID=A0A072NJL5_SCHAZ|nr:ABC transporter permease [Schinkia azotoformans]KEF37899.1 ABC-type transport system, involved in lipoprotein release, permease component [Schinkia azotoformans MEV2011]MEC1696582.1 ABC transporter permease [Schinkia azotoformans]MEC1725927.1 ABC transporter permease [Schinkia azotoformans]MEC1778729.1 ABC transporter permease [Schinkia azotoformans]MED4330727.1 ABC transporter permease [Schinkia azotoformans]